VRKTLVTGAVLSALLGAGVMAAPVAQAGVSPSGINVLKARGCAPSATSVVGNPGDSFVIAVGRDCQGTVVNTDAPIAYSPSSGFIGSSSFMRITLGASGSGSFTLFTTQLPAGGLITTTITVSVTTDEIPEGTVHDDLQQVGVPESGDCADVPVEVGYYPGAPIGGWSKSWAQWINDGKGGEVCTRELEELPDGTIVLIG